MSAPALDIYAGRQAWQHLQHHGLHPAHVALIPAAAGGPKGLILQELDYYLFGDWLPQAPRQRSLLGASIGAWRMAAASQANPEQALRRMGEAYVKQSYSKKPDQDEVTSMIRQVVETILDGHQSEILQQTQHHLHIFTVRGLGTLAQTQTALRSRLGFGRAALANTLKRRGLARHMQRVIFSQQPDALAWLQPEFDAFAAEICQFTQRNLAPAVLASGTLPLLMHQVSEIADASPGNYWDGGIIDYHLALPYYRLNQNRAANAPAELVLYPHFHHQIIPGWLDKALWWRRAHRGEHSHWLDNVIMLSPSAEFIRSLPRSKIPDRSDFFFHGENHAARIREWQNSIAAAQALRDEFIAFCATPELDRVKPLNF